MKSLTEEKRGLLISAKKRGEKEEAIALWLDISVRSVSRIETATHSVTGSGYTLQVKLRRVLEGY